MNHKTCIGTERNRTKVKAKRGNVCGNWMRIGEIYNQQNNGYSYELVGIFVV